jgi:hypothetical protein
MDVAGARRPAGSSPLPRRASFRRLVTRVVSPHWQDTRGDVVGVASHASVFLVALGFFAWLALRLSGLFVNMM